MVARLPNEQLALPLGARFIEELLEHPVAAVRELALTDEAISAFESADYVMRENSIPAFLHSALCAMSLPVRRPKDEFAPIIRQDGNYTLIINPSERSVMIDGKPVMQKVGAPFGIHARLVMLFIMSEAVKTQSREIFLGKSFSAWLRRMGISNTSSGGDRGTRGLVQEQIVRLMSCEWTIRWDAEAPAITSNPLAGKRSGRPKRETKPPPVSTFSVHDMRLAHHYSGVSVGETEFVSRFVLSEQFFNNLVEHAVPLNDRAFAALKKSATQIDLYTYLVYRLPRIPEGVVVKLSWRDLAKHLGNETQEMFKFRQTVRRSWSVVSGVYQQARHSVDFDDLVIRLRRADPPLDGHILKHETGKIERTWHVSEGKLADEGMARSRSLSATNATSSTPLTFPATGSIRFGCDELVRVAKHHGSGYDIDLIADAFRRTVGSDLPGLTGSNLLLRFERFCQKFSLRD